MAKRKDDLSDEDKRWLESHPEFHVAGNTSLGKARKSSRRKAKKGDQEPTFSDRLDDFEAMNSMNDD
jgi:hypothetical protein